MRTVFFVLLSNVIIFFSCNLNAQEIIAFKVKSPPKVDGIGSDAVWKNATKVTTTDKITKIPIELQAVYTENDLYLKIRYPDATENREHKTLSWDASQEVYRTGLKREDSFVVKWNMEPAPVDLSLGSEDPYRADIWFWKAFRTDPVGYCDDKLHIYSSKKMKKSREIVLPSGNIMYLSRLSDTGRSTYKSVTYDKFSGNNIPRYSHRKPEGSRADVHGKGVWAKGYWTIEMKRALQTGNVDDISFNPSIKYEFGVSRHEIAGKSPNHKLEQPYYESGDIGETLMLVFL